MNPMNELLELAVTVASEGAKLAARRRTEPVTVAATKSSPVDVVTAVDREVEALIRDRIAAARPDDGFLGEESDAAGGSSGLTWVVDPIDGTVNFLYGVPLYAVSVAVVEGGTDPATWTPLAGCVVNVAAGEVFAAARGEGATLNGEPISVSAPADLATSLLITGFGYDPAVRAEQGAVAARLLPQARDLRRTGSCAIDLCWIAAGRADAYWERGVHVWDFAAGLLIAAEAGAAVEVGEGGSGELLVVATAPTIRAEFAAALARATSATS
ncbi:MAG: inositol monophosphatase [Microbacteriaceae bacterium]|nr:inositol monophosphatase [Microbacteriaceae bacterium]